MVVVADSFLWCNLEVSQRSLGPPRPGLLAFYSTVVYSDLVSGKGKAWSVKKGVPLACHYCGTRLRRDVDDTRDHIIPRSEGGPNTQWNRVPACVSCNWEKRSKTYEEFTGKTELPMQCQEMGFKTTKQFTDLLHKERPSVRLPLP